MKNTVKKSKIGAILFSIFFMLIAAAGISCALFFVNLRPVDSTAHERTEKISVPAGSVIRTVAVQLAQKKMVRSWIVFYIAARYPFVLGRKTPVVLKSGVYTVKSSMNARTILDLVCSGKQEYIRLSIPEGLTLNKIAAHLESSGVCSALSFKSAASDASLLAAYKIPGKNVEGFLFPDTYFFVPDMSAEHVVRTIIDNFFKHIDTIPALREMSPSDLYNVVILASIVEREYRVDREAPLIASVFTNRIKENVGLYSCATIEYIITEIEGKPHPDVITYDDLKINSPYNTYKWAGLPPGPISNSGMVALQAAANPPETDYYYFRLTDPVAGTHTFSKSFSSHTEAGKIFYTKKAAAAQ